MPTYQMKVDKALWVLHPSISPLLRLPFHHVYLPPLPHHHVRPSIPPNLPIEPSLTLSLPTTSLHSPSIFVFFNPLHYSHKNTCKFPKYQLHLYTQPSFILMCPSKRRTIIRAKALPSPTTLYQRSYAGDSQRRKALSFGGPGPRLSNGLGVHPFIFSSLSTNRAVLSKGEKP